MKSSGKTFAELQTWLDRWDENHVAPDAQTLADFLGIELATEPETPVGQRRRSPGGTEVIKTDDGPRNSWRKYRGKTSLCWFTDAEIAGWEVITDAPEVPEDIIAAVTGLITETGESLQGPQGIARRMADAGLLVGTTPEAQESYGEDRQVASACFTRLQLITIMARLTAALYPVTEPDGRSSFVILERDEVEALVSVLSELLATTPTE